MQEFWLHKLKTSLFYHRPKAEKNTTMKKARHLISRGTAVHLFLILICCIFVGEVLVMSLINVLLPLSRWDTALLDSALLLVLVFPILYFFGFRPLTTHITEREQAEETLRIEKDNLKAIFESSPVGMLLLDEETIIVDVNTVVADMVLRGYSHVVGKRVGCGLGCVNSFENEKGCGFARICPECPLRKVILQVLTSETSVHDAEIQLTLLINGQEQRPWLSISAEPVILNSRKHVIVAIDNITERKKAEETQKQLVIIIEATPDFVGFANAKDKHIIYVNKAGRKMCGIGNDEDVTKLKINDVHPEWTNKMFAEEIMPAAVRDGVWMGECAFLNIRDRREIPVLMVLSSHKAPNGEVTAFSTISRDITERKLAEEKINNAMKQAEAANVAKSQFLANMSHEIRTPMNAIIGFGDILADEKLTDDQLENVNIIRESSKALLNLINDILDFSKIEAGRFDTEIIDCSLGKLLNSIESMMRPKAKEKGIEFKVIENNGLPAQISTDPARLRQCLVNLTGNAIKFTEQGHVYIKVSLETTDNKSNIRFDVEDTGIGVPEDRQKMIFEPFTQADGSTTRIYGGTGLGLTITKQLVKLLGGKLTLTSQVGKGSVFSIVIPAGLDVTKQPFLDRHNIAGYWENESDKGDKMKFSGKVLVAEDVKTNQMLIKALLEKMGIEVTIAEDGNQAMQKALAREFDLIFMDIQMPYVDGYEATRALRAEGITIPIIALTANAMKGDDKKCIEAGCDDYLSKPIIYSKLVETIGKYLGGAVPPESADLVDEFISSKTDENHAHRVKNLDEVVIDWAQITANGLDEQLMKEIIPTYIKDNKEHIRELITAVRKGKTKDAKSHAHAIKGAGRNMGAAKLSELAGQLEAMELEGALSKAQTLLNDIISEFHKLEEFVSKPDWIEIAKREKAVTDEKLNTNATC